MFRLSIMSWLLLVGTLMISSCGFQLRGTNEEGVQIPALYVLNENNFGELSSEIRSALESNGTVVATDPGAAPWSLFVSAERSNRRIATTNSGISVARYELQLSVDIKLEALDGTVLIPTTVLNTERIYEYDSSNLTGSDVQEQGLRKDMRTELVERILRRVEVIIGNQMTR